jgi:hypothetical protein
MAQDSAVAMGADRREFVNCAFKAVERMILPAENISKLLSLLLPQVSLSHRSVLPKFYGFSYKPVESRRPAAIGCCR